MKNKFRQIWITLREMHYAFLHTLRKKARLRSRSTKTKPLKILVSHRKPKWEKQILQSFSRSLHQITFSDLAQAQVEEVDLVIPLTISDLLILNRRLGVRVNWPIPIPNLAAIHLCNDKYQFATRLIEQGFGKYIPKIPPSDYPYYFKKKIDEWGRNTHIVRNISQEKDLLDRLPENDYYAQEAIEGTCEYSSHILFADGKIVDALTLRFVFDQSLSIKGKDKESQRHLCKFQFGDIFSAILSAIRFSGICCVNYKVRNGIPMILEINPRCGQSLAPYLGSFVESAIIAAQTQSRNHSKP